MSRKILSSGNLVLVDFRSSNRSVGQGVQSKTRVRVVSSLEVELVIQNVTASLLKIKLDRVEVDNIKQDLSDKFFPNHVVWGMIKSGDIIGASATDNSIRLKPNYWAAIVELHKGECIF